MTITAAQWKQISDHLKCQHAQVEFSLNSYSISISRERKSESISHLCVYIDGYIKGVWMKLLTEIDPADAFMNQVVKQVWFHEFKARHSRDQLAKLEKIKRRIGVKTFKEIYGEDPKSEGFTILFPNFPSSAVLVRQFKKIEGLTLVTVLRED